MPGPGAKRAAEAAAKRPDRSPAPAAAAAAKLPKSRIRAARQQAVQGVRLAQKGKLPLAVEWLKRSLELDPTVATVQHDLGLTYLRMGRFEEAADALRRAVGLDPELGKGSAHLNLATALDFLGREDEAQAAYEAVVRLDPAQHPAHARLGKFHLANGDRVRAEAAFRTAAAAAPAARARLYEAYAAVMARQPDEAEALLRTVIAADPACGEAHVALGQIMAEAGRSDEAAASFEHGISLDPQMAAAWSNLSTNKKFTARDRAVIDRMQACLERRDLTAEQRQFIHFALGKAHDDIGDYAAAMHHVDAANRLRSAHRRLDRALLARQTANVIASAPPEFLDRSPDFGVDDATPILIVGMPRSGTTLVEQILSSHPDVAAGGELGFWRERNQAGLGVFAADAAPETVRRLADDYLAVLRAIAPGAARVTDKMPFNFAHLGVIRQVFPRATIVHCRRHPIDTCLSIFRTNFLAPFDFAGDRGSLAFFYGEYRRLMADWREVLPPDRFIEVDYEALVADPEPLTRRLVAACGLAWNDACLAPHRNRRRVETASVWQARQPIYRTSVARWRAYEPWLGELRALLPDAATGSPAGSQG